VHAGDSAAEAVDDKPAGYAGAYLRS
jgi:hypothetical protein